MNNFTAMLFRLVAGFGPILATAIWAEAAPSTASSPSPSSANLAYFASLRQAIEDLRQTHGNRYPNGAAFLSRLDTLEAASKHGEATAPVMAARFSELQREALLANPLLDFDRLLVVKRQSVQYKPTAKDKLIWRSANAGLDLGFPSNHECNSSLPKTGYRNEIVVLNPRRPATELKPFYRPSQSGYVGELDLHWDGSRLLFTESDATNWKIWEIHTDGAGLRQVSQMPGDVDAFDACYLPDGRIVFGSTASFQSVPCWHGQKWVNNLYLMNSDGTGVRQLCFDQDHDFHPAVLPNGQVIYHRWDYTGINHIFLRQLMVMNPDGTGQRAIYGANSWYPNALYFPRALPGDSSRLICILSGYHGVHRMGQLVVLDTGHGWQEAQGIVARISGRGLPVKPMVRDNLVDQDWPKFLHPYPLSEKYFLVACLPGPQANWGIYLADIFDNLVLLREEPGYALLEPVPLIRATMPPAIPDRVQPERQDATVYLHDIYRGPGLKGVPRGTIKNLRVIAYHFAYRHLGGPDKIGRGGPWEVMRILGTVPLDDDGSVFFRVPANTPIAVQPLDAEGKAVQLMRSWFTAMPGETLSCVGCHETPNETPAPVLALAARRIPKEIIPWRGPARGFDFAREVEPVLKKHCVSCHDGRPDALPDLRPEEAVADYRGLRYSEMEINRLHPEMRQHTQGIAKYTPAYDALIHYIRRVGIEDDVTMLVPGEYHADTSPLIQMLRKGHQGVELDAEGWDRLVTWIDLNGPCHGTWHEVHPILENAHERRMALRRQFGGPLEDPEAIPPVQPGKVAPLIVRPLPDVQPVHARAWPFDAAEAQRRQAGLGGQREMKVELGGGVRIRLVRIPAGEFVMGDPNGEPDERPLTRVSIEKPFWMGIFEVTHEQYRRFDPNHDSRYYTRRHAASDDQGLSLNGSLQPVVRVSWLEAMGFCRWLSERSGLRFSLPTEAQWEYACRAGADSPLNFGAVDSDFSGFANLADFSFSKGLVKDDKQITGGLEHLVLEGAELSEKRFNDKAVVTADTGSYRANAWGLYDLHGNAAEWTRSLHQPYSGRSLKEDSASGHSRRVVRGGSFFDPPKRARSAFRSSYPEWQRVFNVGFRVVCESDKREVAGVVPAS